MKKLLLAAFVAFAAMPASAEIRNFDFRYFVPDAPLDANGTYQYGRFSYDDQILPTYVDLANQIEGFIDPSITIGLRDVNGSYDDLCGSLCSMSINGTASPENGQPIFGVSVIGSFGQRVFNYYGGTVGFSNLAVPTGFTNTNPPDQTWAGLIRQYEAGQTLTLPPSYAIFSEGPVIIVGEPNNGRTGGFAQFTNAVDPVPEPGVWAMLASGLALVGGTARRRKR